MKNLKFIISIFALTILFGCSNDSKEVDLESIASPTNISAKIAIAPDNTGNVTIIPIGEGVSQFEVHFGDSTIEPVLLGAGVPTTHKYGEGTFTVKVIGITVNGKKSEYTKVITISFFPPTNLEANVSISSLNTMEVNVNATADFETNFRVFFNSADPNDVPETFLQGETLSHVYDNPGTYVVKIYAVSGSAQSVVPFTQSVTVSRSVLVLLPLDFDSTTLPYTFLNFDGGNTTRVANPFPTGNNTSPFVAKMVKGAGQVWGGSLISLSTPINFSVNKKNDQS